MGNTRAALPRLRSSAGRHRHQDELTALLDGCRSPAHKVEPAAITWLRYSRAMIRSAPLVLAAEHDVGVGMTGIVVIDCDPIEGRVEVLRHAAHETAGKVVEVRVSIASFGETMKRNWWRSPASARPPER